MQAKRSPLANYNLSNHSKSNHLMQPLASISKASTPVRTRTFGGSQMNSTPVNIHKVVGQTYKSPNNKENYVYNHIKTEGSKDIETDGRINLSPILTLNKKLSQGPAMQHKKSLTPEGPKVYQDYEDYASGPVDRNYQTLNGSKGQQNNFNNTTNFSNLRTSNSFKNLIENRCRTPTKLENVGPSTGMFSKRDSAPLLKQSLSSNQLFRNFGRQSRTKLMESRSFDKLKSFNSGSDLIQIKCMNNDGKKAKYQVNHHENYGEVQYYCPKCTIPFFVQQEYTIVQLCKQSQDDYNMEDSTRRITELKHRLEGKKKGLSFVLKEISKNEQQELSRLNCYYEDLIGYLEDQRNADNERIRNHYHNNKKDLQKHMQDAELTLQNISRINKYDQVDRLLQIDEQQYVVESQPNISYERLLGDFAKQFQGYFRPTFDFAQLPLQSTMQQKQDQSINNRNHGLRFSFQKLLTDIGSKKSKMQSIMNPLHEEQEQNENEVYIPRKQEHTAFRDLFPDGQERQLHNNDLHSPTFKNF